MLTGHGKCWVSLPGKPQIDRERRVILDERGRLKYALVAAWTREAGDRFSAAAIEATLIVAPDAFDDEEAGQ